MFLSVRRLAPVVPLCAALAATSITTYAQPEVSFVKDYAELVKSGESISAYDTGAFGESVNLATGATEFKNIDVSVPGNNGLSVALGRRFVVGSPGVSRYPFGDWDIEVPYMSGVYGPAGWVVTPAVGMPNDRCSAPQNHFEARPPAIVGSSVHMQPEEYWQGTQIYVPGTGNQELLFLDNPSLSRPTDAATYRWVTKDNWFLSCLNTVANGPGQGFRARSPDGLVYEFNHMVKLPHPNVGLQDGVNIYTVQRDLVRLYATKVSDRHGNEVNFVWSGDHLQRIESTDGRKIIVHRESTTHDKITRLEVPGLNGEPARDWKYQYAGGGTNPTLEQVELPDQTKWTFAFGGLVRGGDMHAQPTNPPEPDHLVICSPMPVMLLDSQTTESFRTATITHPSGATGRFQFRGTRHGRTNVPFSCRDQGGGTPQGGGSGGSGLYNYTPVRFDTVALVKKQITGKGLPASSAPFVGGYQWIYEITEQPKGRYSNEVSCTAPLGFSCGDVRKVKVTAPDGTWTISTFGVRYGIDEGQIKGVETFNAAGTSVRNETFDYADPTTPPPGVTTPFPDRMGKYTQPRGDVFSAEAVRPQWLRLLNQDGVLFTRKTNAFDIYAKPLEVERSNPTRSKKERTTYANRLATWTLGQVVKVENISASPVVTEVEVTYDATRHLPLAIAKFGFSAETYAYETAPSDRVKSVTVGGTHTLKLEDYVRGVPTRIEHPTQEYIEAGVNSLGFVTSVTSVISATNGLRNETTYERDAMGRITQIIHPQGDDVTWNNTTATFVIDTTSSGGDLPLRGFWRHRVATGTGVKTTWLDALWRPVVTKEEDTSAPATARYVRRSFEHTGKESFVSYPTNTYPSDVPGAVKGIATFYDALGRTVRTEADSEFVSTSNQPVKLKTLVEYQEGFVKRVTSPRGEAALTPFSTTTKFHVYDEPTEDFPLEIAEPEGRITTIEWDPYGKPEWMKRSGPNGDVKRVYAYDTHQRLCMTAEPESRASVRGYDLAGNVEWTATGRAWTSDTECPSVPSGERDMRSYDSRQRLTNINYANPGTANLTQTWTADSLPESLTVDATGTTPSSTWIYAYNNRRLLTKEELSVGGTLVGDIRTEYGANGHRSALRYPGGRRVEFAPNALGEATKVTDADGTVYAAPGITRWPNGGLKSFTYGNQIVHQTGQNVRGLPETRSDGYAGTNILSDGYIYDENGNVVEIWDDLNQPNKREMTYDKADRLTSADAFGLWGAGAFEYDTLDNLTKSTIGPRVLTYHHLTANRLTSITGSLTRSYDYNLRGDVIQSGARRFEFDTAHRMQLSFVLNGSSAQDHKRYAYDGHGRRVLIGSGPAAVTPTNGKLQVYDKGGQLLWERDPQAGLQTEYIYLGNTLLAQRNTSFVAAPATLTVTPVTRIFKGRELRDFHLSWSPTTQAVDRYEVDYAHADAQFVGTVDWVNLDPGGLTATHEDAEGGVFRFRVRACLADGECSGWTYAPIGCTESSCTASLGYGVPPRQVPDIDVPVTPPAVTAETYALSWPHVVSATSYRVRASRNNGSFYDVDMVMSTGASTLGMVVRPVIQGMYVYEVTSTNSFASRASWLSEPVAADPASGKPVVSVDPAISSDGRYMVKWPKILGALSYRLERQVISSTLPSQPPGGFIEEAVIAQQSGNSIEYVVNHAANGSYVYRARACIGPLVTDCGAYGVSANVQVQRPPSLPLLTVSGATALGRDYVSGTGVFTVQWQAQSADVAPPTHFEVEKRFEGGVWGCLLSSCSTTTTLWTPSIAEANGEHQYRVKACNAYGCSANRVVKVTVASCGDGSCINELTISPSPSNTGNYAVSWPGIAGAQSYRLRERMVGVSTWTDITLGATVREWSPATAKADGEYEYRIRGCADASASTCGPGGPIESVMVMRTPATAPVASVTPLNPTSTYNFSLSWTTPAGTITHYSVEEQREGTWQAPIEVSASPMALERPSGEYAYRVSACNLGGCGAASTVVVQQVRVPPATTTALWITPEVSIDGAYTIRWTAVPATTRYAIERWTGTSWQLVPALVPPNAAYPQFVVTGRPSGIDTYRVKACVHIGSAGEVCGVPSAEASVLVERIMDFKEPELSVEGNISTIESTRPYELQWTAVSAATEYELEETRMVCGVSQRVRTVDLQYPETSYLCEGEPETVVYRVRACSINGCGQWSNSLTIDITRRLACRPLCTSAVVQAPGQTMAAESVVLYVHTDGLGSVALKTGANRQIQDGGRREYEPYGQGFPNNSIADGPGYTGHVFDQGTELIYMQQRYYDPVAMRFMSIDPVAPDEVTFNRYWYANSNPLKYIDPDGRKIEIEGDDNFKKEINAQLKMLEQSETGKQLIADIKDSKFTIRIVETKGSSQAAPDDLDNASLQPGKVPGSGSGGVLLHNPTDTPPAPTTSGTLPTPPEIVLGHELGHAKDYVKGTLNRTIRSLDRKIRSEEDAKEVENKIRSDLKIPLRI